MITRTTPDYSADYELNKILCPICSSQVVFKHNVNQYKYYFCKTCTYLFLYPLPSHVHLNKYYSEIFTHPSGIINENKLNNRAIKVVTKLTKMNPSGKSLLDIGSGLGNMLKIAHELGLKTYAVEPSKQLIMGRNYKCIDSVFNTNFETYYIHNKRKYDFITLNHVIEHVTNPKRFIKMALGLLNENGVLYIETPNFVSHLYYAEKENYTFLTPPDHIFIFSKYSFDQLLPKQFYVAYTSTYSYPEHFMGILKAIFRKQSATRRNNNITRYTNKETFGIQKKIKYILFDTLLARMMYPLLNLNHYGSILELYIKKR